MRDMLFIPRARFATGLCSQLAVALLGVSLAGAAPIDEQSQDLPATPGDVAVNSSPDASGATGSQQAIAAAHQAFVQRDIAKCLQLLRLAVAEKPNLPPAKLILADMHLRAEQRGAGRGLLEEVALEDPNHPELYRLFGGLAMVENRWTEGVMAFEKALSLPAPATWDQGQTEQFTLSCQRGLAIIAQRRGDWNSAGEVLAKLVEHSPKDANLRDSWATALCHQGQFDKAFEQFQLAKVYNPKMLPPELSLGIMLVEQGRTRDADTWFARAVAANKGNPDVHFRIAVALLVQDRAKAALSHAQAAEKAGMTATQPKMIQGFAQRQLGDLEAAEKTFRGIVAEDSENRSAQIQLALVLASHEDQRKLQRARDVAQALAADHPKSAAAQATLGWVMHRLGKPEEANPLLRSIATAGDADAESLYYLGRFLQSQESFNEAKAVALVVSERIATPGIMAMRPAIRAWVQKTLSVEK